MYKNFSIGLTMHIPTQFIKRHAYQSQFSGVCEFSALYANASFLAFAG